MARDGRSLQTPLARVRGLGSAKHGTEHWWLTRLTSIALVPLGIWFAISVIALAGESHAAVAAWIAAPVNAVLMIITLAVTFHHAAYGVQVVIEDYVHVEWVKIAAIIAVKFSCFVLAAIAIFAVLKIAFGG